MPLNNFKGISCSIRLGDFWEASSKMSFFCGLFGAGHANVVYFWWLWRTKAGVFLYVWGALLHVCLSKVHPGTTRTHWEASNQKATRKTSIHRLQRHTHDCLTKRVKRTISHLRRTKKLPRRY